MHRQPRRVHALPRAYRIWPRMAANPPAGLRGQGRGSPPSYPRPRQPSTWIGTTGPAPLESGDGGPRRPPATQIRDPFLPWCMASRLRRDIQPDSAARSWAGTEATA
ncbi:unnamed protein product [Urochloa humidicola]